MREIMTELQNIPRSRHARSTYRLHFGESRKKDSVLCSLAHCGTRTDIHLRELHWTGKRSALTYITQVKAISLDPHEFAVSVTANGVAAVTYKRPN